MDTRVTISKDNAYSAARESLDLLKHRVRAAAKRRTTLDGKLAAQKTLKELDKIFHSLSLLIFDCEDAEKDGVCDCESEDAEVTCSKCGVGIRL